ncbi:MAG: substrate binding domain-containing protein [Pseudorhodobacter sp.]
MGIRLITRTTRSMEVSEQGWKYFEGCKLALEQIDLLEHEISSDKAKEPSGTIRVASPEGLGSPFLLDVVVEFQLQYPNVRVDLILENQQTDLVSSGVDVSIRLATRLEDSTAIVHKLAETRLSLFASPDYLAARGTPTALARLSDHDCLVFGASRFGNAWPVQSDKGIVKFRHPWKLGTNQTSLYRDAILRGMGIGLLPDIMAASWVNCGALQRLELDVTFPDIGIYALYPSRNYQPQAAKLFIQLLKTSFAKWVI